MGVMKWYFAKDGEQQGPVSREELEQKIRSGELGGSELVWREGLADWQPLEQVEELKMISQPVPAPPIAEGDSPYQAPVNAPASTPANPNTPVPNYLWQSIVVTILCCWPFGIPAIVYAAKVDGLVARGQIGDAWEASNKAKMWAWISVAGWAVFIVGYVLIIVMSGALAHDF